MLYDPKWEQRTETKAAPYSLANLIAWLEQQPADAVYDFEDWRGACMLGQFWAATGTPWGDGDIYLKCPQELVYIAAGHPRTFGGALKRARQFVSR